jgi:hypothetical protein
LRLRRHRCYAVLFAALVWSHLLRRPYHVSDLGHSRRDLSRGVARLRECVGRSSVCDPVVCVHVISELMLGYNALAGTIPDGISLLSSLS